MPYNTKDVEWSGRGLTDDVYMKELKKKRYKAQSELLVPPANAPNGDIPDENEDSRALGGKIAVFKKFNPLTPNYHCRGRTAPLTFKRCILYIYSTNIGTKYFKHTI